MRNNYFLATILLCTFSISSLAHTFIGTEAQNLVNNAQKLRLDKQNNSIKYIKFIEPIDISVVEQVEWLKSTLKANDRTNFSLLR